MGGGAAMRTAAKVAGVGVMSGSLRSGISSVQPPAEHSVRNVSRPVSAIISSTQNGTVNGSDAVACQRPAWELDDWEFAGGEEELFIEAGEPMPRLVFGPAPSLQEAEEATNDLKDALEKVYLSNDACGVNQSPVLSLLKNPDTESKGCITSEKAAPVPNYAIRAFELLNRSAAVQSVVASIASDHNVWDAVMKNEALTEFLQSQKTDHEFQDLKPRESVADVESHDMGSPRKFADLSNDDNSQSGSSKDGFKDFLDNIKTSVIEMVSNLSAFIQNIFGFSSAENVSATGDGNAKPTFTDMAMGASVMGLAVMAIMVVVLKRA